MDKLILGESLETLIDHRGKTPKKMGGDFVNHGVPVASAKLVQDGRIRIEEARAVSSEMYDRWMPVKVRQHDVVLTSEAPLGRAALIPDDSPMVLGQRLFGLRGKSGVLDSRFLFYALQTQFVQDDLLGRSTGTTVVGIRQSELAKVRIPAPSFPAQQAIAAVLGALDDKIAVNERIAETCEDLAMAYASNERWSQFVPLSQLVHHSRKQLAPSAIEEHEVDLYSLPEYDSGRLPGRVTSSAIKSGKFIIDSACVLLSKLNPSIPRVWNVEPRPGVLSLASTEFVMLIPNSDVAPAEVWSVCSQSSFTGELGNKVTGTSNSHQRVRPADLLAVGVPDPRVMGKNVRNQLDYLSGRARSARTESVALAQLRDTLLPKLMSGEIRVRDAEKVVEDAV